MKKSYLILFSILFIVLLSLAVINIVNYEENNLEPSEELKIYIKSVELSSYGWQDSQDRDVALFHLEMVARQKLKEIK